MTKKVVEEAHALGITVEAELGKIFSGSESISVQISALTDPDLALRFVKETRVDALAVSVGTAHGFYAAKPDIQMDLLKKLINLLPVPIVVHGGSGIPDTQIMEMVDLGIAKLNVGTDLMAAFKNGLKEKLIEKENLNIRDVLEYAQEQVEKTIGKIKSTSFDSSIEKARLATQLKVVLESHTILISALATTIPDVYREDIDRVASITQETITKTIDIIDQPVDIPLAPTQTVADQPMASWTPTTSLPGSLPTQAKSTPTVQATPLSSETSPPLILPGASPTPTPTTTLTTAPPKPELPTVVPTRKPTKTPKPTKTAKPTKVPPTRNPHYDG